MQVIFSQNFSSACDDDGSGGAGGDKKEFVLGWIWLYLHGICQSNLFCRLNFLSSTSLFLLQLTLFVFYVRFQVVSSSCILCGIPIRKLDHDWHKYITIPVWNLNGPAQSKFLQGPTYCIGWLYTLLDLEKLCQQFNLLHYLANCAGNAGSCAGLLVGWRNKND